MRNFLEVSSVCGQAAKKSGWPAVAATPNVAIAVVKKLRRSDTVISHLQGFSAGISDLDFSLVHRNASPALDTMNLPPARVAKSNSRETGASSTGRCNTILSVDPTIPPLGNR